MDVSFLVRQMLNMLEHALGNAPGKCTGSGMEMYWVGAGKCARDHTSTSVIFSHSHCLLEAVLGMS